MVIVIFPITVILLSRPALSGWPVLLEIYLYYPPVVKDKMRIISNIYPNISLDNPPVVALCFT
jgi:hypothetical protein